MTISRLCTSLAVLCATIAPAFAADSVFVPNAFVGNWATTIQASSGSGSTTLSVSAMPTSQGRGLIDSLGDPTFSATNCPPANQKSEYYQALAAQGETTFYGCTNGDTLILRFIDQPEGEVGTIRVTNTNIGPPAVFSGSGSSSFNAFLNLTATYLDGNIGATPLARVPSSYILLDSTTPAGGTTFIAGTQQSFTASVRYQLGFGVGTLTALLVNGDNMTIKASIPIIANANAGEQRADLVINEAFIPPNPSLKLRIELRRDIGTLQAVAEAKYAGIEDLPVTVAPALLELQRQTNAPDFKETLLLTANAGASGPFTASVVNSSPWLSVPSQGVIANGSAVLALSFLPTNLAPGFYSDTLRIVTASRTINVPVALSIVAPLPILSVAPEGLHYEVRQGQGFNATQRIYISASGGSLPWTASVTTGASLVQLGRLSGVSSPGAPAELLVTLQPSATNAAIGASYAIVEISTPGQPAQYVTVVSDVLPSTTPVVPRLTTASLTFITRQGDPNPPAQSVGVEVSSQAPVAFTANATGGNWITANALAPATASTTTAGTANVAVTSAGLAPGVYDATVNITIGANTRTARVVLIVQPPLAQMSSVRKAARQADGCTPTRVVLTETRLPESYSTPAGWPQDLIAHLFDNCGSALANGTVIASFNNGDPPLRLLNDGLSGDYFATWQPQGALLSTTTVKLTGSSGALTSATLEIRGTVTPNAQTPPSLVEAGVLQSLNPIIGSPLAPGIVVQVYGHNLASVTESTTAPLPPLYKGTQLLVAGLPSPFYYVSPDVVIAQLPIQLQAGRSYPVIAQVNGAISVPINITIEAARPGVAVYSDGHLIAQHADYTLVNEASPAAPGESLIMYLVGMGATNPPVEAGAFTPLQLVPASTQPVVTIDGAIAELQYAGLTPTAIGLYQINFKVPTTARSADLDVVIKQNGVPANSSKLVVKK